MHQLYEGTRRASNLFLFPSTPSLQSTFCSATLMQSAQTSPTKLKANVIPFPAPSQLSSRSPEEAAAQSPPFELRDERSKGRELAAPIYASVPTPSTAHLREAVGNEGEHLSY